MSDSCMCNAAPKLIFSCAGAADVGGIDIPFKTAIVWITYVIALGLIIYSRNLLSKAYESPLFSKGKSA